MTGFTINLEYPTIDLMKPIITPKSLILGLLQASKEGEIPVKSLVTIGDLFGFTSNTIRVTATRLTREGKLESNERGLYQLSKNINPFSRFVESWRIGEERLILWDGSWMCYLAPPLTVRKQAKNAGIIKRPGFKEGTTNLWVRPNNLKIGLKGIKRILFQLNIDEMGELFIGHDFKDSLAKKWKQFLWPIENLVQA